MEPTKSPSAADDNRQRSRMSSLRRAFVDRTEQEVPGRLGEPGVSFDVRRGEVHCLLGENGAGKSTLAECLYGTYRPDSGTVTFKDEHLVLGSPPRRHRRGHRHGPPALRAGPALSVIENIVSRHDVPLPPRPARGRAAAAGPG